jgi:hypothetical protein
MYIIYGLPMETHTAADLLNEIDEECKIQTDLISERLSKLQNQFENQYVDNNSNNGGAENLAKYYLLYGDINLINTEIFTTLLAEKKLGVAKISEPESEISFGLHPYLRDGSELSP